MRCPRVIFPPYNAFRFHWATTCILFPLSEKERSWSVPIHFTHCFGPTANKLCADRTYITPSDKAGVAINNSPIELVAT